MNILENTPKNSKLIGIGEEGIKTLDSIYNKLEENIDFEKININQDVDKDYVRNLLDGVDILFLTYSTENRRAKDIVKAIAYMASERRVLSIGLNLSIKEDKDELNIDRELILSKENTNKIISLMNTMIESISDSCMINIDLTDLKEVLCSDKGIKYSYEDFNKDQDIEQVANILIDNANNAGSEFTNKKGILFVDMDKNYCEESQMLILLNNILIEIQEKIDGTCEIIFSLNIKESLEGKARFGLIYN